MVYVCSQCKTIYQSEPDDGCQGSRRCARGAKQSLTWFPDTSVHEAETKLKAGELFGNER